MRQVPRRRGDGQRCAVARRPGFAADWDTQTLVSLFDRVQKTMPHDAEGTLSRAQAGDIVAYILQRTIFRPARPI